MRGIQCWELWKTAYSGRQVVRAITSSKIGLWDLYNPKHTGAEWLLLFTVWTQNQLNNQGDVGVAVFDLVIH